jgi:hypothetical protein
MQNEMTVIEVNGVKMEVDLRHAKIIHTNIRVGSKVKVLAKGSYSGPEVYPGVVVGFEPFTDLPTIIVAYIKNSYASAELAFAYINSKSADKWDLVPAVDDELPLNKADIVSYFDRDISKKQQEIADIEAKRDFFLRNFNTYFEPVSA